MGLFDKVKDVTKNVGDMAQDAIDSKLEEREDNKKAKELEKQEQQELSSIFTPDTEMGDISIDMEHRLFKIKHATGAIKKNSGAMKKTGKALAAMYTLGASVAVEAAMKPDDRVFSFDILDSYDLIEDDSSVTSGGLGTAVAGGVLFGGVGAVVGGMTGSKKQKKAIENLVLQINTTDITFPCIMVTYIKKSTKVSSNAYKEALSLAKQSIRCLDIILENEKEHKATAEQPSANMDVADNIKKYKELLDMGAITQEEFDTKKKELLGL